nr:hypothetical protein StreXyl84_45450 [Streptomyces sp. Xyl84]
MQPGLQGVAQFAGVGRGDARAEAEVVELHVPGRPGDLTGAGSGREGTGCVDGHAPSVHPALAAREVPGGPAAGAARASILPSLPGASILPGLPGTFVLPGVVRTSRPTPYMRICRTPRPDP